MNLYLVYEKVNQIQKILYKMYLRKFILLIVDLSPILQHPKKDNIDIYQLIIQLRDNSGER